MDKEISINIQDEAICLQESRQDDPKLDPPDVIEGDE